MEKPLSLLHSQLIVVQSDRWWWNCGYGILVRKAIGDKNGYLA
jgi:hypothetical protein